MTDARFARGHHYPPYVRVDGIRDPKLANVPSLARFQQLADGEKVVKSYDIRIRRPKFPWIALLVGLLITSIGLFQALTFGGFGLGVVELGILLAVPGLVLLYHFVWPRRGHTFLYLTDRRLVIVELEEGFTGRHQTILNYNNKDIAGFQVYAQRGIWRLLNLLKIRETRTFYISLLTGSAAGFTLGAINSRRSQYDPGQDAVTLCAELDSTLLTLKAGLAVP